MVNPQTSVKSLETGVLSRKSQNTFHSSKNSQEAKELILPAGSSQPQCPWKKAAEGRGVAIPVTRQLLPLHALR